ncbi:MAG: amidohydrolase family protein [Bacteroidota bacterium]
MPVLTAKKIHNGHGWLPDNSVIEVADDGIILSVQQGPNDKAVFYEGILAPGFVNVHCHMELSHMQGLIPEHTGLIPFLKTIPQHRNDFTEEQKAAARAAAYEQMVANGIVAVGDIANTTDTLDLRARDKLHVFTFAEAIGFSEVNAARSFGFALRTFNDFAAQQTQSKVLKQAIVPHAPYSVSSALFHLIDEHSAKTVISIHNQESPDENTYYQLKKGGIQDLLHTLGVDDSHFVPTGKTSLQSYLGWLAPGRPIIFVHNTCTSPADIHFAISHLRQPYWCLCPNANMYIENRLPDIDLFTSEHMKLCIGTDSMASNHQLCILSELLTIKQHYPRYEWGTLLTWATYNGAMALQLEHTVGSFGKGMQPGILHLTGLDGDAPAVTRIY